MVFATPAEMARLARLLVIGLAIPQAIGLIVVFGGRRSRWRTAAGVIVPALLFAAGAAAFFIVEHLRARGSGLEAGVPNFAAAIITAGGAALNLGTSSLIVASIVAVRTFRNPPVD